MKQISLLAILLVFTIGAGSEEKYNITQLQGAWWSDLENATADFVIQGNEVWLDIDSKYHPCEIIENILIFYMNDDAGKVENRIISIHDTSLVLKNISTQTVYKYVREKRDINNAVHNEAQKDARM